MDKRLVLITQRIFDVMLSIRDNADAVVKELAPLLEEMKYEEND